MRQECPRQDVAPVRRNPMTEGEQGMRGRSDTTGMKSRGARGSEEPAEVEGIREDQSSSGEGSEEGEGEEEEIEEKGRTTVEEVEDRLWKKIRGDQQRYMNEDENDALVQLPFEVHTTKFGTVYHLSPNCRCLQGPKVGPSRQTRWCPLCKKATMRIQEIPAGPIGMMITGWGHLAHNRRQCPLRVQGKWFPVCQICMEG